MGRSVYRYTVDRTVYCTDGRYVYWSKRGGGIHTPWPITQGPSIQGQVKNKVDFILRMQLHRGHAVQWAMVHVYAWVDILRGGWSIYCISVDRPSVLYTVRPSCLYTIDHVMCVVVRQGNEPARLRGVFLEEVPSDHLEEV